MKTLIKMILGGLGGVVAAFLAEKIVLMLGNISVNITNKLGVSIYASLICFSISIATMLTIYPAILSILLFKTRYYSIFL